MGCFVGRNIKARSGHHSSYRELKEKRGLSVSQSARQTDHVHMGLSLSLLLMSLFVSQRYSGSILWLDLVLGRNLHEYINIYSYINILYTDNICLVITKTLKRH